MSEPDDDLECYCGECAHVGSIHITGRGCAHEHCSCPQFVETPPVPACPSCTALRQQLQQQAWDSDATATLLANTINSQGAELEALRQQLAQAQQERDGLRADLQRERQLSDIIERDLERRAGLREERR